MTEAAQIREAAITTLLWAFDRGDDLSNYKEVFDTLRVEPTSETAAGEPNAILGDALDRVDRWANHQYTPEDAVAVNSPISTFTAGDLRLILAAVNNRPVSEAMRRDMAAIGHMIKLLTDELTRVPQKGRDPVTMNNLEYYASQIAEWSGRYTSVAPTDEATNMIEEN